MIRKLVVSDGRSEREILLVGTIVVGRDPTCQISDLDPLLSRRHAEFVSDASGVVVRDLASRNGIFVNGKKVPEHKLKADDTVQLGHLHVRYIEDATPQAVDVHARTHATTAIGMEVPTVAPLKPKAPAASPPAPPAPMLSSGSSDTTIAPASRSTAAAAAASARNRATSADTATPQVDDDPDATRAIQARAMQAIGDFLPTPDPDAGAVSEHDTTRAVSSGRPGTTRADAPKEARVVANGRLVVTEASPNCAQVIGARSETIVGGALADVLTRSLMFVATGDGPPALSLSVVRSASGGNITVTFKTGQVASS